MRIEPEHYGPFYGPRDWCRCLCVEAQMVETTRPEDEYRTYRPTGKTRGLIYGVRVPAWLIWKLIRWKVGA